MSRPSAPIYSISWQKPEKLARLTWLRGSKDMTDEDFRETLEVFAETALQHRAIGLVIDVREFRHRPSPEILNWRNESMVAKYKRAGVKKLAWIWRNEISIQSTINNGYAERHFLTEVDALAWLDEREA